jgi:uncharacterized protein DUF4403
MSQGEIFAANVARKHVRSRLFSVINIVRRGTRDRSMRSAAQPGATRPTAFCFACARRAITAVAPAAGMAVRDVEVYPSSGKLVVGLRIAKASDADPNAGQWVYLTGALQVDADGHAVRLSDLSAATDDEGLAAMINPFVEQLREKMSVDYGVAYENLLNAANDKLTRPLKDGFRMEGRLSSAKLEKTYLSADGIVIALRASGELKILYGM